MTDATDGWEPRDAPEGYLSLADASATFRSEFGRRNGFDPRRHRDAVVAIMRAISDGTLPLWLRRPEGRSVERFPATSLSEASRDLERLVVSGRFVATERFRERDGATCLIREADWREFLAREEGAHRAPDTAPAEKHAPKVKRHKPPRPTRALDATTRAFKRRWGSVEAAKQQSREALNKEALASFPDLLPTTAYKRVERWIEHVGTDVSEDGDDTSSDVE
jgi:hypothetical protein